MALKIRRVVTGHDDSGRAIVAIDEICKNVMSRRPNHESCVVWSTGSFPADNSGTEDGGLRPVATTDPNGTVFRIGVYHPGVAPRNHRTESIDYAIVLSGEIWAVMDEGETKMVAGDVLIQRGTNHAWANRSNAPCVVAFVLIDAKPLD
ncbi:MAG: cupin domain-containing protein [Xanthobacteraceae bacterium]